MNKLSDFISFLEETTSTNLYLKDLSQVEKLSEGFTVHAEFQKSGKGCGANRWESQKGKNVLFSSIFYPEFIPVPQQFILSEITALSILDALKEEAERSGNSDVISRFSVKWPNDIYWEDKKIAGILVENTILGNLINETIIGVGVNINQASFSEEIPNPVSLTQILGRSIEKRAVFISILHKLHIHYLRIMKNDYLTIHQDYMSNLYRKSGLHLYHSKNDGYFKAYTKSIDSMGTLLLETESGEEKSFLFKEVTFEEENC